MSGPPLESLLVRDVPGDAAARERALAVARAELTRPRPARTWRGDAVRVLAVSVGLTAGVTGVFWALGRTSGEVLAAHALRLAGLWLTSAVCAWSALAPRRRGPRRVGVGLALAGAVALVLARDTGPDTSPSLEWMCTVSHLAVGVLPGLAMLAALRGAAFHPWRALLGGLSVGCVGAFLGELACTRGGSHVLLYHLSAWALATLVILGVSWVLPRRSFAP